MALSEFDRELDDGTVERFCPKCREWKLKEEYFRKNGSGRRELCAPCDREMRNEKRQKLIRGATQQLIKQLGGGKPVAGIEVPHTSEMASAIVKNLGGLDGLAQMYTDAMQASYAADPTSKVTLEYFKLTAGIITKSTDQRETAPDVAQMSDEDLNVELTAMIGRLLDKDPNILNEIMETRLIEDNGSDG